LPASAWTFEALAGLRVVASTMMAAHQGVIGIIEKMGVAEIEGK
jgi:hypothetical protein